MKFKPLLLAAATTLLSSQMSAGEVVFYITEDGAGVRDLAVTVNGQRKLVNNTGFVSFDVPAGDHQVEFSKFGEWLGDFQFSTANATQQADIQVELVGGEPLADVFVYEANSAEAQAIGVLAGYLQSEETGGVVSGARVAVSDELAVMTDDNGYFSLSLPRGEYQLTVAHPNYGRRELSGVRVMANAETNLSMSLSLSGSGTIEEIVAVGSYVANTATAQQRDSSAVLNAIGSEQLARFGDSSAASALKRVSGVSVVGGQFAVVRGLQGRYISSTLNGSLMPSTDPMRRDVPLDLFPSSVLGGINIQKSYTPDLPGDTTGGAIMMETKGLPDELGGKVSISTGFNDRTTFNDVNGYRGGNNDWLGIDDGTREIPSYAYKITDGGRDSIDYCSIPSLCLSSQERIKLGQSFENIYNVSHIQARPDRGFSISYADEFNLFSQPLSYYAAFQYSDQWNARHNARVRDTELDGTYERSQRNIDVSGYLVFGSETSDRLWQSKTILLRKTDDTVRTSDVYDATQDQVVEETILQWVERQYLGQQFSATHYFGGNVSQQLDWRVGIAQTQRNEPDRRSYSYINDAILPSSLERRYSELTEVALDLGLDYQADFTLNHDWFLTLKSGAMLSQKERDVEMLRFGVRKLNNANIDQSVSMEEILSEQAFLDGVFGFNNLTAKTDSYEATDQVVAGYLAVELEGERLALNVGARIEDALQEIRYPEREQNNNELKSNNVLPNVSLRYGLTDNLQVRAGVSQTLSRPGITERSSSAQYDPETDRLLRGNPELAISEIDNLDLRLEYYWSDEESVSLAWFRKDIDSPIERTVIDADGSAANGFTFRNEDDASLQGLEFDARKRVYGGLDWDAVLSGNLTYIDSKVNLSADSARLEGRVSRDLQGQSKWLANIQLELDYLPRNQSLTVLVNYFGDRIYAASRGNLDSLVEDGRMQVDLVYKWVMSDTMSLSAKAQNITDEAVVYSRSGKEIERYFNGSDYSVSFDYKF